MKQLPGSNANEQEEMDSAPVIPSPLNVYVKKEEIAHLFMQTEDKDDENSSNDR